MLSRHHAIPAANLDRGLAESAALTIVPARADNLSPGYYLARKRAWLSAQSWEIVLVARARPRTKAAMQSNLLWVYVHGGCRPSRVQDWLFRDRICGIKEISREWRELAVSAIGISEESPCAAASH